MGRTKGLIVLAVVAVLGAGFWFSRGRASRTPALHLYAWSNYFSDEQLGEFTRRTGIPVALSVLSSNEELFAKLKAGATGYDLIQPSDYMVRQLVRTGMLEPLDAKQIPNLKHLSAEYREIPYDPGQKYSVPVSWGTVGISVDTARFPMDPKAEVSWNLLLESPLPKQTSLLDDMREVFNTALYMKGFSPNTRSAVELGQAKELLSNVRKHVLLYSSEPKSLLLKGEVAIAHTYSIDAAQAHAEKSTLTYYLPKEGATIWTDNLAIPKGAKNIDAAHRFVDFMMEPEQSAKLSAEKRVGTPNEAAMVLLPKDVREDEIIYPPEGAKKRLHYLDDLGDSLPLWTRLWTELKS